MRNVQRYAVLVAAAFLAACGGDDKKSGTGPDGDGLNGNFTATLTGDITGALAGSAGHAAVSTGEDQGFVMAFDDTPSAGTTTATLIIGRENPALPSTGQHTFKNMDDASVEIGPDDYAMLAAVTDAQGTDWICGSTGGTMNVTSSSAARIKGSLNITVSCRTAVSEAQKDITIKGNFDSRGEQVTALRTMVASQR